MKTKIAKTKSAKLKKTKVKKQSRTVHVLLSITDNELSRLHTTLDCYAAIFNEYAAWFVENKTTNTTNAHKALYDKQITTYTTIPTAVIQAARNRASACVKSYNSNNPDDKYGCVPEFSARCMSYPKTAVSLTQSGRLTFSLADGKRGRTSVNIPKFFTDRYGDWSFQSAYVGVNKNGRPFANLVFVKNKPAKRTSGRVVGIDRGIYNTMATSDREVKSSKRIRRIKRKYRHNRFTLQRKVANGSRSAARRLKAQSGKEARFTRNENHIMTKALAEDTTVKTYVLEDLTGIRESAKKKKNQTKKYKKRSKKFNIMLHSWSFSEFEYMLIYKCMLHGISVEYVNPKYTSQTCSRCSYRNEKNRDKDTFICLRCGYTDHADINAAINIRDLYISTLHTDQYDHNHIVSNVWQGACQSPNDALSLSDRASHAPYGRGN